jgi:hypothetical protein
MIASIDTCFPGGAGCVTCRQTWEIQQSDPQYVEFDRVGGAACDLHATAARSETMPNLEVLATNFQPN